MENLVFGILTVLLCAIGYMYAFKQFRKDNVAIALFLIVLCGLFLRIYTATDFFLHTWDERYHALVAKNLINNPWRPMLYSDPILPYDFKNWVGNHIWLHKQPLPLWTMAASMSVFGINEIALRLPSILLSTLGIGITFYIAKFLFDKRVGIIAAFLFSIHGLIIELCAGRVTTDHIDVFFLFFIQLAVLFAIKFSRSKNTLFNILCGISVGLAILSKWLPALIVVPIWVLLAMNAKIPLKKLTLNFLVLIATIALVSLPWQLYIFHQFPLEANWESSFNVKHLTESIENHGNPFYYHLDKIRILYGEIIYLPVIWFFYKSFKRITNYKRMVIAVWLLIPLIFFSIAITKMQAYTILAAPAIFILTALFWRYMYIYRRKFKYRFAIYIVLLLLIGLPVRYAIERVKPFMKIDRNPQWTLEIKELNHILDNNEKTVIFNSKYPIETMFYTDAVVYSTLPNTSTLSRIKKMGYTIYIREEFNKEESIDEIVKENIVLPKYNTLYRKWQGKQ